MGTRQTLANLEIQLADNTSGAITPETIRDLLATLNPANGSLFENVAAPTTIAVAGTYVKAAGTTTAGELLDMSMPADNRLQYDGVVEAHLHCAITVSFVSAGNNQVIGLAAYLNGALIPGSIVRHKLGGGGDVSAIALHTDIDVVAGDFIELWLTNETGTATVTIEQLYMSAFTLPH